jgi:hypothetical protein
MLAGPVVLTLAGLLQVTRCSWVTTSSPSSQSIRTSSLARALRRSTTSWPTAWQRHDGFVSCLWSCIAPCRGPLWSTVITSVPSTYPPTPFSTSAPSILRLISTLSASALPSGTFVSSTFRRLLSPLTSSARGYHPRCSQSFGQISTSVVARVLTRGC